ERKLDGERCGALRRGGRVTLLSRTGRVMDGAYPELVDALLMKGPDFLIDGEIVAFKGGQSSFERLQQLMQIRDAERARRSPVAELAEAQGCARAGAGDRVVDGAEGVARVPGRAAGRLLRTGKAAVRRQGGDGLWPPEPASSGRRAPAAGTPDLSVRGWWPAA